MTSLNRRGLWLGVIVGSVPLLAMVNGCGPEMPEQTKDAGVMMGTDAGTNPEPQADAGMQTPTDAGMQTPTDAGMQMPVDAGISFSKQIQPIFNNSCVGCHQGAMPQGGLALSAAASHASMVDTGLKGGPCSSSTNFKRVTPGNPNNSMLYLKMTGSMSKCGQQMPPSGLLPEAQRTLIRMWIEEGAKNN